MPKKKPYLVVIGAGAIGRGYLPWVFADHYDLIFVDANPQLVRQLRQSGGYTTHIIRDDKLESKHVTVAGAFGVEDFDLSRFSEAAGIIISVGPRNTASAAELARGARCPILVCENARETVDIVRNSAQSDNVSFAIPDVIASNTASPALLKKDPLAIVTEDGTLFIDDKVGNLKGSFVRCNEGELEKQWIAKLYLHNTPHCIAAYLGAYVGLEFIHETMRVLSIELIVRGAMQEMLKGLKLGFDIPPDFLDWYADKELSRFSCNLLYDPISRVAREPLRKLELDGRLLGAAQVCLSLGFVPDNILIGTVGALMFQNSLDPDDQMHFMSRMLPPAVFLSYVLSLRRGEALEIILRKRLSTIMLKLDDLRKSMGIQNAA